MKPKSILFSLVFALCANMNTANAQVNVQDSLALVDLFNSTNGPNWYYHDNWLTNIPVLKWYGIKVENTRVTEIRLSYNNLKGNIPSSIANLASLSRLWLSGNELSGNIPSSIGHLKMLRDLWLDGNLLSGSIPSSIGNLANLNRLRLHANNLNGTIPSSLGNLSSLTELSLGMNQLSGSIPSSIGNLVNLDALYLNDNQFTDSLPSFFGNLVNLLTLELARNQWSGSIPSSFGNLKKLIFLYLNNNQLSGSIPESISNLPNLYHVELENNKLTGSIPSSIGNLGNLGWLDLFNNRLSGSIPSSVGNLANLFRLHVENNKLSGMIPSSLANIAEIDLNLSHNYFIFDGMELIVQKFPDAIYAPQKNIFIHQNGNALSVSAGGTLSNNTYKWFRCEGTTSTLVATIKGDSVFHPSKSGRYHVKILNSVVTQLVLYSKAFDYTSSTNNIVLTSAANKLQQDHKTNLFIVYPNPAKEVLFIQTNGSASFSMFDQSGKILLTADIDRRGSIDISHLNTGIYYLNNNNTRAVQKIVIER